jgi:hypothetical protein
MQACRYPIVSVGSALAVIQDGLHGVRHYVSAGVPLIGVGNVTDDGIDLSEANHVTPEEHARLAGSQVWRGDLLVTITGRLGSASIYDSDEPANLSAHVALCRANPDFELLYLKYFFASRLGAASFSKAQIGSTHPHINVRRLAELPMPLPPLAKQRELVYAMETAREARRVKLAEADALLAGMDAYLLETLGLEVPRAEGRHVFAMTTGALRIQSRLGPDYFHPERVLAIRAMHDVSSRMPCVKLLDVVSFVRDQVSAPGPNYLGLAGVQSHTGELSGVAEKVEGTCFEFQTGDVLFARLRPYLNKVWCADVDGCCSPEFHVLRIRDSGTLASEYLAAALRSSPILAQTRHMMTGNTHPRLANEDVAELFIPIPELAAQESIAIEVRRRRERARALRAEAEQGWAEARHWFAEQLLGPAP